MFHYYLLRFQIYQRVLLWCLRRNVEASCHKHFVVRLPRTRTTPLIAANDKCYQLATVRRSCVYNTWPSHPWQKTRFLLIPPASDAPVRDSLSEYCYNVWCRKKLEWCGWLPNGVKFSRYVYLFRQNTRTWQTDGRTPHDGIGRA